MSERHAILGAGGIGGLMGALLAAGGDTVTLIVREATLASYPPQVTVQRPDGSKVMGAVRVASSLGPDEPVDVLWVTTKARDLEDALRSVSSAHPRGVVPLLNGIDHLAVLEKAFGASAVLPATIAVEAERLSPGVIRQGSGFIILRVAERGRALLTKTAEILKPYGVTTEFVADEKTLMWSKLVFLAPFALTTAASGQPLGYVRDNPQWRALLEAALGEATAVGRAEGATLDPNVALGMMKMAPPQISSSMARDVAAGNEPELDAIGGAIIRAAGRHGIPVPAIRELMQRVRDRVALGATH